MGDSLSVIAKDTVPKQSKEKLNWQKETKCPD